MKRILRLFRDMKFRYKLILTYIFICAVPVLFFGGFSFARVQNESEHVVVKKSRHEKYLFLICFFKSRHEEYFCRSCFFKSGHGQ